MKSIKKIPKNRSKPWWLEKLNFVDPNPDELSANQSHKSYQWRNKMWPKRRSIWTTGQDFPCSTNVQLVSGTKSPELKNIRFWLAKKEVSMLPQWFVVLWSVNWSGFGHCLPDHLERPLILSPFRLFQMILKIFFS